MIWNMDKNTFHERQCLKYAKWYNICRGLASSRKLKSKDHFFLVGKYFIHRGMQKF